MRKIPVPDTLDSGIYKVLCTWFWNYHRSLWDSFFFNFWNYENNLKFSSFFDNIERITAGNYIPTEIDILNSYAPTIGIDQINYRTSFASIRWIYVILITNSDLNKISWISFLPTSNIFTDNWIDPMRCQFLFWTDPLSFY